MSPYASPNDHRRYHYLELANRLRVLLICDPRQTNPRPPPWPSAPAISTTPSIARAWPISFEHMLFLGTRTYPKPGEYQRFMRPPRGQQQRLDRGRVHQLSSTSTTASSGGASSFLQFFIRPTFAPSGSTKERNAVDSNIASSCRTTCAAAIRCTRSINPAHPSPGSRSAIWTPLADAGAGSALRPYCVLRNPLQRRIAWRW